MIRFFKSPQLAALFSIPLIVILLWAQHLLSFRIIQDEYSMPLWSFLADIFVVFPSWLNLILFMALISFEAIYFNLLSNRHEVLYRNSYLPALFFVLLVSAIPAFQSIHPVHFVNLILLRILDKLFSLYKNNKAIISIFDCGFLAGLAAQLYFPSVTILILLMLALSLLRPFQLREWLVLIISYLIPFFFVSVIMFWNHELKDFWKIFFHHFRGRSEMMDLPQDPALQVLFGVAGFILILALLRLRKNYYKNIIRVRTYQQLLFFTFLLGLLSVYLAKNTAYIHFIILIIPLSMWFTYFFVSQKKKMWMAEGLLLLLIGAVLWNHVL